jgi:Ca-activated chloride channel family protein
VELYDLQPGELPDLFGGDELVVLGRYRGTGGGEAAITVRGRRNGREERFTTALPRAGASGTDYIAQLWAARKAAALARSLRLNGQSREVMDELRQLALRYGILTEYTAYLVQEPNLVANRLDRDRAIPAPASPMEQSGAAAVGRAQREERAAKAMSLDAVAQSQAYAPASVASRRAGGRMFVLRDSIWTDLRHGEAARVVTVQPYSDAYFALLRALPELVQPASLEPSVLVAGARVSIKIGAGGLGQWSAGELEEIVRKFRA